MSLLKEFTYKIQIVSLIVMWKSSKGLRRLMWTDAFSRCNKPAIYRVQLIHFFLTGVTVKVYMADMEKDVIVEPPSSVRAVLVQNVGEFKALVAQV